MGYSRRTDLLTMVQQTCSVCHAVFESRTKLFDHIKDEGHAAIKTVPTQTVKKAGKKKR